MTDPSTRSALQTFLDQLEAFNAHDLEEFIHAYADDAVIHGLTEAPLVGKEAIAEHYASRFKDTSLLCTVEDSIVFEDRWVVANEIVWRGNSQTTTIALFDVRAGRISRAMLMKS